LLPGEGNIEDFSRYLITRMASSKDPILKSVM
jgi:hypothetical protein